LQPGTRLRLRGQLRRNEFHVRSYDLDGAAATADFAPVYPASEEVTSARLRTLVESALPAARDFGDSLPASLRARERLPLRYDALVALHRPRGAEEAEAARRRLALDELLLLQVGLARIREGTEEATAPRLGEPGGLVKRYRQALPFELTQDQEQAIAEIDADLAGAKPMQRLLQGDVGSGKTVVALYALLRAVEAGKTGALMAPTETLAEQHFLTLEPICTELGVRTALLTGSVKGEVEDAQVLVGTHCADPGRRLARRPRGRGRRRAAPVRCRTARRPGGRPLAARPPHDRNADPAHAGADRLRRSIGDRDREAAGQPEADRDQLGDRRPRAGGVPAPAQAPR
jgi:RecG-like helicase